MQEKVPAKIQEETKKDEIYVSVKKKKSTIEYEKDLKNLQIELLKFQNYVKAKGLKVLILNRRTRCSRQGRCDKAFDRVFKS